MDGYRGDHAGMGALGLEWSDFNPVNLVTSAASSVYDTAASAVTTVTAAVTSVAAAAATKVGLSPEAAADAETEAELAERAGFVNQFAAAFGAMACTSVLPPGATFPGQVLTNAEGLVDSFAVGTPNNFRTISAENKQHLMDMWAAVEDQMKTAGIEIPRVWDKPIQEWAGWGYDKGVLIVPQSFNANGPLPEFLKVRTQAMEDGSTQVNASAMTVWRALCDGPVRTLRTDINAQWIALGKQSMVAAEHRVAQAEMLLRAAQAVATLGFSELSKVMTEKWAEMKKQYTAFRSHVAQYNSLMANPAISAKDKEAARAQAGPIVERLSGFFSDESSGKSLDQRMAEEDGSAAVAGLGVFAALPAIWAGIQIAGVVAAIAILVWAIAKLWPIISALLKLLGGLNKMTGGLLIPALIVGGVGWIVWRKFGGKAKSLFAKG